MFYCVYINSSWRDSYDVFTYIPHGYSTGTKSIEVLSWDSDKTAKMGKSTDTKS